MTRLERMEESLKNYEKKIVEITANIAKERESIMLRKDDAMAKLREAQEKFKALYGVTLEDVKEDSTSVDNERSLFDEE
jgi:hypothetical protein